jgi:hypothetical protein
MWTKKTLLECITRLTNETGVNKDAVVVKYDVDNIHDINDVIRNRFGGGTDNLINSVNFRQIKMNHTTGKISYIKTEKGGDRSIENQKISKLLSQNTKLKPEQIAQVTSDIKNGSYYLLFAHTDYRIWYVAANEQQGFGSCMSHPAKKYERHNPEYDPKTDPIYKEYIHPVDIYATNKDIKLALMFNENPFNWNGETDLPVIARALVTSDKEYPKAYGKDSNHQMAIEKILISLGYYSNEEAFNYMQFTAELDNYDDPVVPYFDGSNQRYDVCGGTITINSGGGEWETDHETASHKEAEKRYCHFCDGEHGETENSSDLYDAFGHHIGEVLGDCREGNDIVYLNYGGMDGYTNAENTTFSDYEGHEILDECTIKIWIEGKEEITYEGSHTAIDAVELYEEYEGVLMAEENECIETFEDHIFLKKEQSHLYTKCAVDGLYYTNEVNTFDILIDANVSVNTANLEGL